MKTKKNNVINEERQFLMEYVLNIGVLTYSEKYSTYTLEGLFQEIEQAIDLFQGITLPENSETHLEKRKPQEKEQWEAFQKRDLPAFITPQKYKGKGLPKSLKSILMESCISRVSSFSSSLLSTFIVANLIEKYGDSPLKKHYCKNLYSLDWIANLSLFEGKDGAQNENQLDTTASKEGEQYLLKGKKEWNFWGDQGLTDNTIHIVSAKITNSSAKKKNIGLFIVPGLRVEKGKEIDNQIKIHKLEPSVARDDFSAVTLSFGEEAPCYGDLLCQSTDEDKFTSIFQDIFAGIALNQIAHLYEIYQLIPQSCSSSYLYLKSLIEGLRNSIFSASFYEDCFDIGGKEQKIKFQHLWEIYSRVFPLYTSRILGKIEHSIVNLCGKSVFTSGNQIFKHLQYIKSISLLTGSETENSAEFIGKLLTEEGSKFMESLLSNFEEIDSHLALSEALQETILIWREYTGALILIIDDIKRLKEEKDLPLLYSEHIIDLLGDLILCFHLIKQGVEAEKQLLDYQTNFFLLKKEVEKNPASKKWYNKLIIAEFFATNLLVRHEGTLKMIQRYSTCFSDFLLED